MAGFRSVKKYAEAWDAGRSFTSHSRDAPSSNPASFLFVDFSTIGGGPPANYYAASPTTSATLDGTTGIYHGDNKSPSAKYLASMSLVAGSTAWAGEYYLLDYLLYYPFFDGDDLTSQVASNTVTLPRYESGEGVQVMAVCQTAGPGGGSFTFTYVNNAGVEKTSPTQFCALSAPSAGNIIFSNLASTATTAGVFCPLDVGDTGVRQIKSVQVLSAVGGLFCLVLVKPLATMRLPEGTAQAEKEFVTMMAGPPRVYDGAYLNLIGRINSGIGSQSLAGTYTFIWDEGT